MFEYWHPIIIDGSDLFKFKSYVYLMPVKKIASENRRQGADVITSHIFIDLFNITRRMNNIVCVWLLCDTNQVILNGFSCLLVSITDRSTNYHSQSICSDNL